MKTDRTIKVLLGLIALALWGILLQPVFRPVASHAAPDDQQRRPEFVNITGVPTVGGGGTALLLTRDGQVFQLHPTHTQSVYSFGKDFGHFGR